MTPASRHLTRRGLVAGAAVALGVASAGWFGRFAVGGTFEAHVAETLGLDPAAAAGILDLMRDAIGADYDVRAAGFVAATTSPGRWAMPTEAREEALEAFLGPLFGVQDGFVAPQVYVGLRRPGPFAGCLALVRD